MSGFVEFFGPWWPLALVVLVGFLPSEIWRLAAALLARWIGDGSELFVWVRLVASALVAAVVIKLLIQPPPALETAPLWARLSALALGLVVFFALRRRLFPGIAVGLLAMLGFTWIGAG